jgi:hypothetical protein
MLSLSQGLIAFALAMLGAASSAQTSQSTAATDRQQAQAGPYSVKAEVHGSDGAASNSASLELRGRGTSVRLTANADSTGKIVLQPVQRGTYDLSIEAVGFNVLSRTIKISGDIDLGRVLMDRDTDPLPVHHPHDVALSLPADESRPAHKTLNEYPDILRGRIAPASFFTGKRLMVQLSCSEQPPGLPQLPPIDMSLVAVDENGGFETPIPDCFYNSLAHREIRFCLKQRDGRIVALMLPKRNAVGYYQSRLGIWLPVKSVLPQEMMKSLFPQEMHEAEFALEYTDSRPLQASISVTNPSWGRLDATLTNTSEEVIAISSPIDFLHGYDWVITNDRGNRMPRRIFWDRTGEQADGPFGPSHFLFPGESETEEWEIAQEFNLWQFPGTYHAVARRIIRRPELPGEQQIGSPELTFVITPLPGR